MSRLMFGRRLMRGCGKVLVASSATAAFRHQKTIAGLGEIVQQFARIGIVDDGSHRHGEFNGFTLAAAAIAAFPMPSALGGVFGIKTEVEQRVVMRAGHHGDVAAASTVARSEEHTSELQSLR